MHAHERPGLGRHDLVDHPRVLADVLSGATAAYRLVNGPASVTT